MMILKAELLNANGLSALSTLKFLTADGPVLNILLCNAYEVKLDRICVS